MGTGVGSGVRTGSAAVESSGVFVAVGIGEYSSALGAQADMHKTDKATIRQIIVFFMTDRSPFSKRSSVFHAEVTYCEKNTGVIPSVYLHETCTFNSQNLTCVQSMQVSTILILGSKANKVNGSIHFILRYPSASPRSSRFTAGVTILRALSDARTFEKELVYISGERQKQVERWRRNCYELRPHSAALIPDIDCIHPGNGLLDRLNFGFLFRLATLSGKSPCYDTRASRVAFPVVSTLYRV